MYDLLDNKPYLFLTHNNAISGTLEGECAAKQVAAVESGKQTMTTITGETDVIPQPSFKLPQGVLLTGNIEADEDIIAFYRAKEVLLARAKGRG
jgi:hypothetical protein